jgi:hypothetical protein
MRNKKKDRKAQEASDKAIMASVAEEMGQPRVAKSASTRMDKQINARNAKPE